MVGALVLLVGDTDPPSVGDDECRPKSVGASVQTQQGTVGARVVGDDVEGESVDGEDVEPVGEVVKATDGALVTPTEGARVSPETVGATDAPLMHPHCGHAVATDCPVVLSASVQNPALAPPTAYVSHPPNPPFHVDVLVHGAA
jgi:hypothetical protein